jgi:hypothetical protein
MSISGSRAVRRHAGGVGGRRRLHRGIGGRGAGGGHGRGRRLRAGRGEPVGGRGRVFLRMRGRLVGRRAVDVHGVLVRRLRGVIGAFRRACATRVLRLVHLEDDGRWAGGRAESMLRRRAAGRAVRTAASARSGRWRSNSLWHGTRVGRSRAGSAAGAGAGARAASRPADGQRGRARWVGKECGRMEEGAERKVKRDGAGVQGGEPGRVSLHAPTPARLTLERHHAARRPERRRRAATAGLSARCVATARRTVRGSRPPWPSPASGGAAYVGPKRDAVPQPAAAVAAGAGDRAASAVGRAAANGRWNLTRSRPRLPAPERSRSAKPWPSARGSVPADAGPDRAEAAAGRKRTTVAGRAIARATAARRPARDAPPPAWHRLQTPSRRNETRPDRPRNLPRDVGRPRVEPTAIRGPTASSPAADVLVLERGRARKKSGSPAAGARSSTTWEL